MDPTFANPENSKTSQPLILILNVTDKLDLIRGEENTALSNLSISYTWKNKSCNNNKFKTSAPTWNDKFELPDGSYSISDIQEFLSIFKKNMKVLIIHQ